MDVASGAAMSPVVQTEHVGPLLLRISRPGGSMSPRPGPPVTRPRHEALDLQDLRPWLTFFPSWGPGHMAGVFSEGHLDVPRRGREGGQVRGPRAGEVEGSTPVLHPPCESCGINCPPSRWSSPCVCRTGLCFQTSGVSEASGHGKDQHQQRLGLPSRRGQGCGPLENTTAN